jgi:hypothetical protein
MKNEPPPIHKGKIEREIDSFRQEIRKMGRVLAALPINNRDKPNGIRASWPDFHQDNQIFSSKHRYKSMFNPSPREITQADKLLQLVMTLDEQSRRIVMARAMGVPWRRLEEMDGRSHTTLRKVETSALISMMGAAMQSLTRKEINS